MKDKSPQTPKPAEKAKALGRWENEGGSLPPASQPADKAKKASKVDKAKADKNGAPRR